MKNPSRTDWAALEAMDDEDIDYSDIPPLTEKFFQNATLKVLVPSHRTPTHPGELLEAEFLKPMAITQKALAEAIYLPHKAIESIIQGHSGVTPSVALRLARYFGNSADFWLNVQLRWDLYHTQQVESEALASIQPRQSA